MAPNVGLDEYSRRVPSKTTRTIGAILTSIPVDANVSIVFSAVASNCCSCCERTHKELTVKTLQWRPTWGKVKIVFNG
ncbi:hypothetical protein DPMN_070533 [Dreissena polymorpha]|uniref:Uncharacterized protein n=1 Tax=Dreissena polymorpha TaxID=45954 RepID=A0A9D4BVQ0_DREPO|nr:hypothetical protein DPMN_070533 [Dreissena polymorpha]